MKEYKSLAEATKHAAKNLVALKSVTIDKLTPVELLPCPFCGGGADLNYHETFTGKQWHVFCAPETSFVGCVKQDTTYARESEAIKAWNTRRESKADGWQDISTAPRDGKSVLLFDSFSDDKSVDGYAVIVGRWCKRVGRWEIHCRNGIYLYATNPTHWQPMSTPPERKQP